MASKNPILQQLEKDLEQDLTVGDPVLPELSKLQEVETALEAQTIRIVETIEQLEADAQDTKTTRAVIGGAITAAGTAKSTIKLTKLNAELEAQNFVIEAFEAAGGRESQIQLITELADDSDRVSNLRDRKLDIIDDKIFKSKIFNRIVNEFRSIQVDAELESAILKRQSTATELANIQGSTESINVTENLTKKTLNEGVIEANLATIQADTDFRLAQAELEGINANSKMVTQIFSMRSQDVTNALAVLRLESEEENRELQRLKIENTKRALDAADRDRPKRSALLDTQLELAKASLKAATNPQAILAKEAQIEAILRDKEQFEANQAAQIRQVQEGLATYGLPQQDDATVRVGLSRPGLKQVYDTLFLAGSGEGNIMGLTPADAFRNRGIVDPNGVGTKTPVTELLDTIATNREISYQKNKGTRPRATNTLQQDSDFNQESDAIATIKAENIIFGDATNPYQGKPFSTLSKSATIQNLTFYKKVLEPMQLIELNPETIIEAAVAGIQAKPRLLTIEEAAAGIEAIFEFAAFTNNTVAGGYKRIGFPQQFTYNVQFKAGASDFEKLAGIPSFLAAVGVAPIKVISGLLGGESAQENIADVLTDINIRGTRFITVDLMSRVEIKLLLVKFLNSSRPVEIEQLDEDK